MTPEEEEDERPRAVTVIGRLWLVVAVLLAGQGARQPVGLDGAQARRAEPSSGRPRANAAAVPARAAVSFAHLTAVMLQRAVVDLRGRRGLRASCVSGPGPAWRSRGLLVPSRPLRWRSRSFWAAVWPTPDRGSAAAPCRWGVPTGSRRARRRLDGGRRSCRRTDLMIVLLRGPRVRGRHSGAAG